MKKPKWIMEKVNWWNPWRAPEIMHAAVGATPNQAEQRTSSQACTWAYEAPLAVLHFIDPFFEPYSDEYIEDFADSMLDGALIAPPQVWLTPDELAFFPENAWYSEQAKVVRKKHATEEDKAAIVRKHEGRHRLLAAHILSETCVPVQMWLPRKED